MSLWALILRIDWFHSNADIAEFMYFVPYFCILCQTPHKMKNRDIVASLKGRKIKQKEEKKNDQC